MVLAIFPNLFFPRILDFIVDLFPNHKRFLIRERLAEGIRAVISQAIFNRIDQRGFCVALDIAIATYAVRTQTREGKTFALRNIILQGKNYGMQDMDDSIMNLVKKGWIDVHDAYLKVLDKEKFKYLLKYSPSNLVGI